MKLGVLTVPLYNKPAEEAFKWLADRGVQTIEIGTGGSPGKGHCDVERFLSDEKALNEYKAMIKGYGLEVSAFSTHSNHVHPNEEIRILADKDFRNTLKIAEKFGVDTVVTFSGCPGDHPGAKYANWVTCSWPDDFKYILEYQWDEVLIPFWKEAVKLANSHGVSKIALEPHPGFNVYNTSSMLRLRDAVGETIGANFDPSHLFWQGIRPSEAIKELGSAIHHFHAKDTKIDRTRTGINGVLDTSNLANLQDRSWLFRTVGYGHGEEEWKEIISALRLVGYDGALSIEHEDAFMSIEEGLEKAITFLKGVMINEKPMDIFWA